ncbi:NAD(P)/FAD-dependent oxidoreductase [Fructobacillus sp. M1-13]|uniref:Ferredoxin--NADP reductase n=1 Tax=Fructobacillus papyriferae TaxID=2713171 RepID=A0ABS5QRP4_9LACO|nr:NAD(P)/FAD-dependent oxidoreductase [Fructobacillus papyriferae]MBS9335492.1 NAD(P)/FAD-dependent oxidoreductase [Fructobacillus papyriferae]MCD2159262.1 NAD(P)/FAD-dependent oxidoreductase [Fructobacillus papyriferae]
MNDTNSKEMYDIVVVGAGPVGLFAGYYASLRDAKVLIIEAKETVGGQVKALYPDKKIWDVAGLAGETGRQLIEGLKTQAKRFDTPIRTNTRLTGLKKEAGYFVLELNAGEQELLSKTVILATGKGAFEPRRLQVVNESALLKSGLSYEAIKLAEFAGKRVAVLGGGDSAVDLANELANLSEETYLIHRRENFRAMEQSVKQLNASSVIQKTPYKVQAVRQMPSGQLLISLADPKQEGQIEQLLVDRLVVQYGFKTAGQEIRDWPIDLNWDKAGLVVSEQIKTKQEGLFAIGDLSSYPEHVDLIATGFGQAPAAVNAALALSAPEKGGPGHSSSLPIE